MSALQFDVDLEWRADQRSGEITAGEARACVSEPRAMGGTGTGMSPEDLFVAATASSYCVTLSEMLRAVGLPQSSLSIHAEGLVASDAAAERFTTVIVRPTIQGADVARRAAYAKAAIAARNNCFIGKSIRGNIAYVVGEVCLAGP
jgi:peroxiredoxin-like protein